MSYEFYLDDELVGEDSTFTYLFEIPTTPQETYTVLGRVIDPMGASDEVEWTITVVNSVDIATELPAVLGLSAYPNPFNANLNIDYSLPTSGNYSVKLYNILGHQVSAIVSGYKQTGSYSHSFDMTQFSSGTYFIKLQTHTGNRIHRVILMK